MPQSKTSDQLTTPVLKRCRLITATRHRKHNIANTANTNTQLSLALRDDLKTRKCTIYCIT